MDILTDIESLYLNSGRQRAADGSTAMQRALQCAQLAEWAHADCELVAAAFLHQLGALMLPDLPRVLSHSVALATLGTVFGPGVTEPLRLQSQAAHCLRAAPAVSTAFAQRPHGSAALQLCRWIELAPATRRPTPPLAHFMQLLSDLAARRMSCSGS